jgi:hypothetical protein
MIDYGRKKGRYENAKSALAALMADAAADGGLQVRLSLEAG